MEDKPQNKIVQTYAEDMAKVIEGSEGEIIKKMIHEQEAGEALEKNLSPESKKNQLFMFSSVLFIFLASIILIFLLFFRKNIYTIDVQQQFAPIIFNDQSSFKEVTGFNRDQIFQSIVNEANSIKVKTGGVEGIYLTENKAVVGLREFLKLTKSGLLASDLSFVDDNFLIGAVNQAIKPVGSIYSTVVTGGSLFILLKMRSFSDIFNGMRIWEAKMLSDLHGLFEVGITPETNYLFTKDFEDGIVQNKNARILYDQDGKVVLMYVFADDTSLVIANNENAVGEVMLRLAGSTIKK